MFELDSPGGLFELKDMGKYVKGKK